MEWKDSKWKMFHMFARQINDFETHTYAIPETTFLFSSNLLLNLKQENNSIFGISFSGIFFSFFSIFFFFEEFIPSFYFWFFFLSFFEQLQQNKMHPHTCLLVYYHTNQNPKHKNTRSLYHCLANNIKQGWDGVGEQKKRLMSV